MAKITVSVDIPATPEEVWLDVRSISSHVEWMADAEEIRFIGDQVEGVGTTFECDTKVGPFGLTDVMKITAWEPEKRMGVEHVGLITGTGEFVLQATPNGSTFTWVEELHAPWFLGGPIGAAVSKPILTWVWKRNLTRLKARFIR